MPSLLLKVSFSSYILVHLRTCAHSAAFSTCKVICVIHEMTHYLRSIMETISKHTLNEVAPNLAPPVIRHSRWIVISSEPGELQNLRMRGTRCPLPCNTYISSWRISRYGKQNEVGTKLQIDDPSYFPEKGHESGMVSVWHSLHFAVLEPCCFWSFCLWSPPPRPPRTPWPVTGAPSWTRTGSTVWMAEGAFPCDGFATKKNRYVLDKILHWCSYQNTWKIRI